MREGRWGEVVVVVIVFHALGQEVGRSSSVFDALGQEVGRRRGEGGKIVRGEEARCEWEKLSSYLLN